MLAPTTFLFALLGATNVVAAPVHRALADPAVNLIPISAREAAPTTPDWAHGTDCTTDKLPGCVGGHNRSDNNSNAKRGNINPNLESVQATHSRPTVEDIITPRDNSSLNDDGNLNDNLDYVQAADNYEASVADIIPRRDVPVEASPVHDPLAWKSDYTRTGNSQFHAPPAPAAEKRIESQEVPYQPSHPMVNTWDEQGKTPDMQWGVPPTSDSSVGEGPKAKEKREPEPWIWPSIGGVGPQCSLHTCDMCPNFPGCDTASGDTPAEVPTPEDTSKCIDGC